ncbi:transcriptional regulator, MarR family [Brucella ovis ATCC 25840]|uniref:Transcriptional regulator, MarR family n=1 Tax=Brucella ovis (strain ATCC 25840 / 63/290 / NCTC 10512) TaxID=444178 RepID=A0A0H3ATG3_BRUO2|nr:transcriptional regulator, MarR family [Brucella ovis ATCC 25840]
MLICKASSAHGCSPLTTLNQNFVQKGILECRQALERLSPVHLAEIRELAPKFIDVLIKLNKMANEPE